MQSSSNGRVVAQVVPVWQPAFLAELEKTGNISASCAAASVKMEHVRARRLRDPEFNDRVTSLLRTRKLERDPNDQLVEVATNAVSWLDPWDDDPDYTIEQALVLILSRTLNASVACRMTGVPYSAYSRRRAQHPEFNELCRLAIQKAIDELEGAVYTRALIESDQAAIALLRAHRPEVYKREDVGKGDTDTKTSLEEAMKRGFAQRREA